MGGPWVRTSRRSRDRWDTPVDADEPPQSPARPALVGLPRPRGAGARRARAPGDRAASIAELVLRHRRCVGRRRRVHRDLCGTSPTGGCPGSSWRSARRSFVAGDVMWNWYEMIGEDPFPSLADVALPRRLPVHRGRPAPADPPPHRRRRPRRPPRCRDPDDRLSRSCPGRSSSSRSWCDLDLDPLSLAHQPRLPGHRPAAHRRGDGPADDAGRPDDRRSACSAASLVLLVIADQIYAIQNLDGSYVERRPARHALPVSYLLFGAGRPPPVDAPPDRPAPGRRHVARARPDGRASPLAMVTGPLLVTLGPTRRRPGRRRRRDRLPVAPRPRPPGRSGRHCSTATSTKRRALEVQLSYQAFHDPLTGPRQPAPLRRRRPRRPLPRATGPDRWPPCSSTSTTSRPSTTASAMPPATNCWSSSPSALRADLRRPISPRASAATSSGSCCSMSPTSASRHGRRATPRAARRRRCRSPARPVEVGASIGIAIDTAAMRTRRRPAGRRGRRDVPGQGAGQGPTPGLRTPDADRRTGRADPGRWSADEARPIRRG